jgi:hypothetical protein
LIWKLIVVRGWKVVFSVEKSLAFFTGRRMSWKTLVQKKSNLEGFFSLILFLLAH